MTSPLDPADRVALADLVATYAEAVDRRDFARLTDVFVPDCVLDTGTARREGIDAVVAAMDGLRRYTATSHMVGQQLIEGGPDEATGVVRCTAHHLRDHGDRRTDRVMHIRYHDDYVRTAAGWRIARRRLDVLWTDESPVG